MTTTFLFINEFNEQGYPCLVLNESGNTIHPLEIRDFITINALQTQGKTIVVLSCEQFSLHDVELPLLSDKKVRSALPYALEDNLTQAVEELHFAFDRRHYSKGHYLVAVCDQTYLLKIITQLTEQSIRFDAITLDWFSLKLHESMLLSDTTLIHHESFRGILDLPLAEPYLKSVQTEQTIYLFQDSATPPLLQDNQANGLTTRTNIERYDMPSKLWISQRLLNNQPINLCQGLFQQQKTSNRVKQWYTLAASLFAIWLITLLSVNGYQLIVDHREITALDKQIAVIYHQFFPQATQVISPRFRITQFLKSTKESQDQGLWLLLSKSATTIQTTPITIEQLNWQNQHLLLTVAAKDFETLDTLQSQLKQKGLQVKQTQASTKDAQVVSTLELSL